MTEPAASIDASDDAPAGFRASLRALTPGERRLVAVLGTTALIHSYDVALLSLALPQIQAGLGIADAEAGRLLGFVGLGAIPALFLALLADRFGRRRLLLGTIVGFTLCTVLSAFARTAWEFAALQFLARAFIVAEDMVAIVVIAEELSPRLRGLGFGLLSAFGGLGHGVAALLFSGVNALPFGWRALYVFGVVPILLIAWLRRGLPETRRFAASARARAAAAERGDAVAGVLAPLRALATRDPRRLAAFVLTVLPFFAAVSPALSLQSKFLQDVHGWAPGDVAMLYLGAGGVTIVSRLAAGVASDRFGRRRVMMLGLPFLAAGILLFYDASGPAMVAGWSLMVASMVGVELLFDAIGAELFPTAYRSTASGVRAVSSRLGAFLGLSLQGALLPLSGSFGLSVSLLVPGLVVTLVGLAVFLPETARLELETISGEDAEVAPPGEPPAA